MMVNFNLLFHLFTLLGCGMLFWEGKEGGADVL